MPKKVSHRTPTKPHAAAVAAHRRERQKRLIVVAIMSVLVLCLAFATWATNRPSASQSNDSGVHVSLGALEYSFSGMTATKRTDSTVTNLQSFLEEYGKKDILLGCKASYYNVIAYTKDESQILLHYGCDYPNARMFAVKAGTSWRLISPTNHFDQFGIPECSYVEANQISREIAPVCVDQLSQPLQDTHYRAR